MEVGLVGEGGFALIIYIVYAGYLPDAVGQQVAFEVHPYAVGLDDGGVAVDVDDEAGQAVAFAVDEAVGVVVGAYEPYGLAHAVGLLEAA